MGHGRFLKVSPLGLGLALPLLTSFVSGCFRVAGSVAQPTALELQLLGAYEELDEELVQASSVRGPELGGGASVDQLRQQAMEHRAIQQFNEDDLKELKDGACVAETLKSLVAARRCSLTDRDGAAARRLRRVVEEENRAREALITWAAYELARREGRIGPTRESVAEVREAYRRLLRETAGPGHVFEETPGVFRERPK